MPVSSTGYTQQGFSAIRESIAAGLRSGFGQDFLTAPATDGGVLCDLVAASLSEAEAALEALTQCFDRRAASGAQLEALGALLGCYKSSATYGTVTLTIEGADGTVIPAGTSIDGPDGSAWQTLIALEIDATGIGYVPAQCTVVGAIEAPADTLTDDADMPDGVTSVTNESDAVIGSAVQSDSAYRVTILERLAAAGTATYDALYARLKAVNGAGQVKIYRNTLDVADAEGRKPGSIEVVTLGGNAEELATAIWSRAPMGCDFVATGAAWSHDVIDAAGGVQTIRGSYAIDVSLYATITLETESGWSSTTSPDAVKAAIVAWADASLWIGDTVYLLGGPQGGLKAVVASILGVKRVGVVTLHRSGEAGTADQDYTVRPVERARLAKGRIVINA